jgi:Uma2 family endonuclease
VTGLAEYVDTSYRPDCDFIDGEVRERNVGEYPHARWMGLVMCALFEFEKRSGIWVCLSLRTQVSPTRIRVPDVVVMQAAPAGQIVTEPPFVCVEILSPRDGFIDMWERIDDYLAFGVRYVWVINPENRRAFVYTAGNVHEAKDGVLTTTDPEIRLNLAELE